MKKYRILVGIIMALSIIIIGTSEPAKNLYKASNLISKGIKVDDKKKIEKDQKSMENLCPKLQKYDIIIR